MYHSADCKKKVRKKLVRYMRANSWGSPTLGKHMAEALGVEQNQIVMSTLQRFLRGESVNDQAISFYLKFTESIDVPLDPIEEMGEAMSAVMGKWANNVQIAEETALWNSAWTYRYLSVINMETKGDYVVVEEAFFMEDMSEGVPDDVTNTPRIFFKGVGVTAGGVEYFVLKDEVGDRTRTITMGKGIHRQGIGSEQSEELIGESRFFPTFLEHNWKVELANIVFEEMPERQTEAAHG